MHAGTRARIIGMRKLVFCNRKGGVGKTASAINVAAGLGLNGKRTLVIDLDSQMNATQVLADGIMGVTVTDVLLGGAAPEEAIVPTSEDNVFLLPGAEDFANFPGRAREVNEALPQLVMRERLKGLSSFDYVIVDCPAALDLSVINALAFGSEAWVPIETSSFAVVGIHRLQSIIQKLRDSFNNTQITLAGVFMTLVNPQTISFRNVADHLRQHFGDQACRTAINRAEDIKYALGHHQSIFTYAPGSRAAEQYLALTNEIAAYERHWERLQTRVG